MVSFILGFLLATLSVLLGVLYRTYQHVPLKELKRLARKGDEVAALLYRVVSFGMSLRGLLGGSLVLAAGFSVGFFVNAVGLWWGVLLDVGILALGAFMFVPYGELTQSSLWLAKRSAPVIAAVLERTQPVLSHINNFIRRHRPIHIHTGLYEKSDLVELLERQKSQPDNRMNVHEMQLLQHALTFGDTLVADALVPKRVVKLVSADEHIGPVLMDELAQSGHSRFPVYQDNSDTIVGILYLHDLVGRKQGGVVRDAMVAKLTYVHEDFTLYQTLQAFLKTKQHLFLVVNSFEELVGVITIEDVIEQMIGKPIMDEFDQYEDLRAVAAAAARKEHKAHNEPTHGPDTTTEATEVVE